VPGKTTKDKKWRKGRDYFRLDGATTSADRQKFIVEFNKKKQFHLFLLSTKAGGLGINLQSASRVVIFDACFNPCHDTQALFRTYRFGQTRPVFTYRFISQGTIEDIIFSRQISKQGLIVF
jgi:RAD54-like protein 2